MVIARADEYLGNSFYILSVTKSDLPEAFYDRGYVLGKVKKKEDNYKEFRMLIPLLTCFPKIVLPLWHTAALCSEDTSNGTHLCPRQPDKYWSIQG